MVYQMITKNNESIIIGKRDYNALSDVEPGMLDTMGIKSLFANVLATDPLKRLAPDPIPGQRQDYPVATNHIVQAWLDSLPALID